jgi:phosphatidate cytidylyltransferase
MASNMAQRIGFAAVAIPLAVLMVWNGGWPLAALVATVAALGARELIAIAEVSGNRPLRPNTIVLAGAVPLAVHAAVTDPAVASLAAWAWPYLVGVAVVVWLGELLLQRAPTERPLAAIGVSVFTVVYCAVLPSFLIGIRHGAHGDRSWGGAALVFFPLVVIWVCDTAAMFAGKAIGGPKLAPVISPGKTRVGGVAGILGGLAVAPLFAFWLFPAAGVRLGIGPALVIALLLAVVGQMGDLAESLFKREAGVKDSSTLIPGHGGVLDRFDALYLALPVAALCYRVMGIA